jgi:hypothetical protein
MLRAIRCAERRRPRDPIGPFAALEPRWLA